MATALDPLLRSVPRAVFVAGKGGVGKTSVACALALGLADAGRRTLLVSTDPASNLDEVLGVPLGPSPTPVPGVPRLSAANLDPVAAAKAYRERVVGPWRGVLPADALASVEEQLSGACTVEIAAFDEFSRLLAAPTVGAEYDHVVFDTAPTGHTLRLLELPAAWSDFLASNAGGASCLGPLAGLGAQRALYDAARRALADPGHTAVVLVARPDAGSLAEADRARAELAAIGVRSLRLVVNGVFRATDATDPVARALEAGGRRALAAMPEGLAGLDRTVLPLLPTEVVGLDALRRFGHPAGPGLPEPTGAPVPRTFPADGLGGFLDGIAVAGRGVVLTMGKGGVGKTRVAGRIAEDLARRGFLVHWTTTDPAGQATFPGGEPPPGVRVSRIDPRAEVRAYAEEVLAAAADAPADVRALLEEDLRSPCTEEIAVFRALARVVEEGLDGFVVIDTAPTGHTVLLLDAAGAYHRAVARAPGAVPDAVRSMLPRLRDPAFTHVVVVTLPESTPVHEAAALQDDLRRAGIEPYGWVVNQCLSPLAVADPVLVARRRAEGLRLAEVSLLARRVAILPWSADAEEEAPAASRRAPAGATDSLPRRAQTAKERT